MIEQTQHPNLIDPGGGPHKRLPLYSFKRPRCPLCQSIKLHTRKSIDQGDNTTLRYYRCAACLEHFRGLIE